VYEVRRTLLLPQTMAPRRKLDVRTSHASRPPSVGGSVCATVSEARSHGLMVGCSSCTFETFVSLIVEDECGFDGSLGSAFCRIAEGWFGLEKFGRAEDPSNGATDASICNRRTDSLADGGLSEM